MNGHPTREEDFDLYALGALEGEEKLTFASHVAACADCARKLAEARGRIALLAAAAPPQPPRPQAKERLLRRIRASAEVRDTLRAGETQPPSIFPGRWWTAILAPAAVALAAVTAFLWIEDSRLRRELDELRDSLQRQVSVASQNRAIHDLLAARDTVAVTLAPSPEMPGAKALVLYNARQGMVLYNGNLPAPPPGKTYQLWLVPAEGNPVSAGIFSPGAGGTGAMMLTPVAPGITAKAFAVTLEPAGGMPQPTGPKILIGPVS